MAATMRDRKGRAQRMAALPMAGRPFGTQGESALWRAFRFPFANISDLVSPVCSALVTTSLATVARTHRRRVSLEMSERRSDS